MFGLIIGSFLNVVILRFGTKNSISKGSSMCPKCKKDLKWYELIPVLSWIFQLGKCTKCKNKISVQYPLVELSTGILFVMQYVYFFDLDKVWVPASAGMTGGVLGMILGLVALCLLVVIFVYDLYHKIIPDVFSFSFAGIGLTLMLLNYISMDSSLRWEDGNIWNLFAPLILYLPFYLLWKVSDGAWIGLGDGKLAFGFGAFLGLVYGLSAIILSFWIGAVFAIGLMLFERLRHTGKHITMKTEIPFGPFMIIAFLIVYFYQIDVVGISNLFNVY